MKYFTLLQLNKSIQNLIQGIDRSFWIIAEVAQFQIREHAYLELVQKEDERIVARSRAMIWATAFDKLQQKLGNGIFEILKEGTEILVQIKVTFHEIHGLSFNVLDLDEKFTIGALELKRRETLQRIIAENILEKQKELPYPIVPQRIAVISSDEAAGYTDFIDQLTDNSYHFRFYVKLFSASVQGHKSLIELTARLSEINFNNFDVIVLIRGGGSRLDLEVFNEYELLKTIAEMQIPVLTGVGHQKDETLSDLVAYKALKTPTAVAEYLITNVVDYWRNTILQVDQIAILADDKLKQAHGSLELLQQRIAQIAISNLQSNSIHLVELQRTLLSEIKHKLLNEQRALEAIERQVGQLDPIKLLKRGFSITLKGGRPVSSKNPVQLEDDIETILAEGTILSKVTKIDEENKK